MTDIATFLAKSFVLYCYLLHVVSFYEGDVGSWLRIYK